MTEAKLSGQETIKRESDYLRGSLNEELADLSTDMITDAAYELMKFHGSYFGYDRDTQLELKKAGLPKKYEFMVPNKKKIVKGKPLDKDLQTNSNRYAV